MTIDKNFNVSFNGISWRMIIFQLKWKDSLLGGLDYYMKSKSLSRSERRTLGTLFYLRGQVCIIPNIEFTLYPNIIVLN